MDLNEAPVTVRSNDGRDELGNAEGDNEGGGRTLHEEEAVGTSGEDKCLRDDGDLEVDDHAKLFVVGLNRAVEERNAEGVLEEGGLEDDAHQSDTGRIKG